MLPDRDLLLVHKVMLSVLIASPFVCLALAIFGRPA